MTTRCVAPVSTAGGTIQCISSDCDDPTHRRFDRWAPALGAVWAVKPWWPNLLGWAQDHGRAHVDHIIPCRHCTTPRRVQVARVGWPPTRRSWLAQNERHAGRWWVRWRDYVIGDIGAWERSGAS